MNCTRMYYVLSVCVCKYQRVEQTFYNLFKKPLSLCCGTEHAQSGRPEGGMACLANLMRPSLPGRPEGDMASPQIKAH